MYGVFGTLAVCFLASLSKVDAGTDKIVCYYASWAVYRPGDGKFDVEDIDPTLCTHLIFAFTGITWTTNTINELDPGNDLTDNGGKGAFKRFVDLKKNNPNVKTMIANGGWGEGSVMYSNMASNPAPRSNFIKSVVEFLNKYNFDGFDLDWEYPGQRGGGSTDKANFVLLVQEMKEEFNKSGFILSATVAADSGSASISYDIPAISRYFDFINLKTYDFHGPEYGKTGHPTGLRARPTETGNDRTLTVEAAVKNWISAGADPSKLVLGMALYGRSFNLANPALNGFGALAEAEKPGPYTQESGMLGYNEICLNLKKGGWTVVVDNYTMAPYAYKGNQWVGYDDVDSLKVKAQFAQELGLGGAMVWSVDTDDFKGKCHDRPFPLLSAINEILKSNSTLASTAHPT